jgi:hypothetical protein
VEKHAVEGSPLGMPSTIHSGHGERRASRNGPSPWI